MRDANLIIRNVKVAAWLTSNPILNSTGLALKVATSVQVDPTTIRLHSVAWPLVDGCERRV